MRLFPDAERICPGFLLFHRLVIPNWHETGSNLQCANSRGLQGPEKKTLALAGVNVNPGCILSFDQHREFLGHSWSVGGLIQNPSWPFTQVHGLLADMPRYQHPQLERRASRWSLATQVGTSIYANKLRHWARNKCGVLYHTMRALGTLSFSRWEYPQ